MTSSHNAAQSLRTAMQGWGTDEGALISVVSGKTSAQLLEIRGQYEKEFKGRNLINDLKDECKGDFEDTLVGLFLGTVGYDAFLIRNAVKGIGTKEEVLSEVLCTRTPAELKAIAAEYKKDCKSDMATDVKKDTSGSYQALLLTVLTSENRTKTTLDSKQVASEVAKLFEAGENKMGTDEKVFISIIGGHSAASVQLIAAGYLKTHGQPFHKAIKGETSGSFRDALLALSQTPAEYTAEKLHLAMKGAGTNEKALTRLLVSQKERHLKAAAALYEKTHSKALSKAVSSEVSGDYKKLLIALIANFTK